MAKKKTIRKATGRSEKTTQPPQSVKAKPVMIPQWIIPSIIIITILAYIPVFNAGFVTFDDAEYVYDNYLLKDISHWGELLTANIQGNYHPLTMLTLAINYQISGLDAWSYHVLNLLLHLINCILVFRLVFLLSNKNIFISFTTAILFAIHPMHVESVAWVSERKDSLYGLFFLAGLISYIKYIDAGSKKQYAFAILFLILSLLSKPAAVIFPIALFCIDLLRKRKLSWKLIIEKIPFFLLAVAAGAGTLLAQKTVGATGHAPFSLTWKILFGCYGIMMYSVKMFLPFNLSPFYSFPAINENLPVEFYVSPLFVIAMLALFYYGWKKNRAIAFGISFYLVNLLLVLQFMPVGGAIMSERYTYIPYIGLFFIIGWLIEKYAKKKMNTAYSFVFVITIFFSVLTFKQAGVWKSGYTLWDQAIKAQPSSKAYSNRAQLFRKDNEYSLAIEYYREALRLNKVDYETYAKLGNVYFDLRKPDSAFICFREALSYQPDYHPAMDNMGAMFAVIGKYDSSLKYLDLALKIKPDYKSAYSNRALTYMAMNRYEEAIKDWEKYLIYDPNAADVYSSICVCYQNLKKYEESLAPINKAIAMTPKLQDAAFFYLNRSYSYNALKNLEMAKQDALKAKQGGIKVPDDYARSLGIQ